MSALARLREAYENSNDNYVLAKIPLPTNGKTLRQRRLDCATFNLMHSLIENTGQALYDTVRAAFWEGGELFPGSGFYGADHTQICVRNLDCVLGYFRPL